MTATTASVGEIIDTSPIGSLQKTVFVLCALVSLLDGFNTQSLSFVAPALAHDLGIAPTRMGALFSATLLGSVVGVMAAGVIGDRFGRRGLTIAMTTLFALMTGACALTSEFGELVVFRLIAGVGLGGVVPGMLALTAEYAPGARRTTITTLTFWGYPAGAVLGGIAAGPVIAHYGWRAVFVVGAVAPLLLVVVMLALLPESLRYLEVSRGRRDRIVALLQRIDPVRAAMVTLHPDPARDAARGSVAELFRHGLASRTLLLSTTIFISLFLSYLLISWVPSILAAAGVPLSQAILGAAAINLGGIIGSYAMSRMIDRREVPAWTLAGGYVAAAVALGLTGLVTDAGSIVAALAMLGLCGVCLIGTQLSTSAYASVIYPVELRGTGIGFVQGIGRVGSLPGPLVGGALVAAGLGPRGIFLAAMGPALLAAMTLALLGMVTAPRRTGAHEESA